MTSDPALDAVPTAGNPTFSSAMNVRCGQSYSLWWHSFYGAEWELP